MSAFCDGLNNVLKSYREEIVSLEDTVLKNPHLPLSYFLLYMEKYDGIFNTLLTTINAITEDNIHGCLIVGRLFNTSHCSSIDLCVLLIKRKKEKKNTLYNFLGF